MSRYIDAEKLKEQIEYATSYSEVDLNKKIDEIPMTDVVEVVRCKDCKYYRESPVITKVKFCYRLKDKDGKYCGYNFSPDDFCSRGERK